MAYPAGVSVAAVTVGSARTFFGGDASLSARVTPVIQGTNRIIHAASGTLMVPAPMTFTAPAGGALTFSVPHVDQPGWVDGSGAEYTMWAYKVDVTASFKNGRTSTSQKWVQNFQPLVGQDLIDLDLIGDGPIGQPVSAPLPEVLSVNGQTGAVVIETSDGGLSDPDVADLIYNDDTLTAIALNDKYAASDSVVTSVNGQTGAVVIDGGVPTITEVEPGVYTLEGA